VTCDENRWIRKLGVRQSVALLYSSGVTGQMSPCMKSARVIRTYYVLPCCLLLLNLCVELVSYKAKMIEDVLLRTAAIMGMVLFGGSLVAFLVAPAIGFAVGTMQHRSRREWGGLGEMLFLLVLGIVVFWLYYRIYILGPESVLPAAWRNPPLAHHPR
jgi:hypothetical protein